VKLKRHRAGDLKGFIPVSGFDSHHIHQEPQGATLALRLATIGLVSYQLRAGNTAWFR
jgi:hypothetical protein